MTRNKTIESYSNVDLRELLSPARQVAIVWSTEDVHSVRPDLSDAQAWAVLQECEDRHDCEYGFTWSLIELVANELFPKPVNHNHE